jgi:GTP-binding protein YchF
MKIGLYGYEGAGATTLFNALTGQSVATGFGGERQKVHLGTVKVPDARIDILTAMYKPKKTVHAELVFSDFPAVSGEKGKALSNVSEAKAVDILALVIGAWDTGMGTEKPDPANEFDNLVTEMVILDLVQVERFIERSKKIKPTAPLEIMVLRIMEKLQPHLEEGLSLRTLNLSTDEVQALRGYAFLSLKPSIVAVNVDEGRMQEPIPPALLSIAQKHGTQPFLLSAKVEEEISKMSDDEQTMFLEDLGIKEPLSGRFIRATYSLSNLVSFFTVGEDEVRSWPIQVGTNARKAAGTIHSDLEKGFIRAEVFHYDDIVGAKGDEGELKKHGKLRVEGKEYPVKDGDIINIRFNV